VRPAGLLLALLLAFLALAPAAPHAAAAEPSFQVTYDPPLGQLEPQGNPDSPKTLTTITVKAVGADGRPLRGATVDVTLTAPSPSPLLRSDVPRIEGRTLLHTTFAAPDGRYSFRYLLPIRGEYRLDLAASPAVPEAGFEPFSRTQTFAVAERGGELATLLVVLAVLFGFGLLSAVLLLRPRLMAAAGRRGGAARPSVVAVPGVAGAMVAMGALLAVFVGFVVIDTVTESRADARILGYEGDGAGVDRTLRSGPAVLTVRQNRSSEDGIGVQTLVRTRGQVHDARTGEPLDGAGVRIEALDLESGAPMFVTEAPPARDGFAWDLAYWDGVDYETSVTALPAGGDTEFRPVSSTVRNAVEAVAPAVTTKLLSILYLLAPLVAGILAGLFLAQRRWGGAGRRPRTAHSPGMATAGGAR
jgi:hypothetical protein